MLRCLFGRLDANTGGGLFLPAPPRSAPSALSGDCATSVVGAVSQSCVRPAPRTASGHGRRGRSRGLSHSGVLRPCIDDLHAGFGRTQWEFD
jgi:hypothetical protein